MAIGDIYRTTWVFEDTNLGNITTTHMDVVQEGLVAASVDDYGEIVKEWWDSGIGDGGAAKAYYKTTTRLNAVKLRRIDPLEPIEFTYTTGLPIAGTETTDQLPSGVAVLVSLRTAKIGRSYRGRMYLPSIVEQQNQSEGALSAASAEDIAEGIQGVVDAFNAGGVNWNSQVVVYSPLLGSGEPLTHLMVDRRFRSQRRRAIESTLYVSP